MTYSEISTVSLPEKTKCKGQKVMGLEKDPLVTLTSVENRKN